MYFKLEGIFPFLFNNVLVFLHNFTLLTEQCLSTDLSVLIAISIQLWAHIMAYIVSTNYRTSVRYQSSIFTLFWLYQGTRNLKSLRIIRFNNHLLKPVIVILQLICYSPSSLYTSAKHTKHKNLENLSINLLLVSNWWIRCLITASWIRKETICTWNWERTLE